MPRSAIGRKVKTAFGQLLEEKRQPTAGERDVSTLPSQDRKIELIYAPLAGFQLVFLSLFAQINQQNNQANQDYGQDDKEWNGADEVTHVQLSFLATPRW